jgi:hypothetical protein
MRFDPRSLTSSSAAPAVDAGDHAPLPFQVLLVQKPIATTHNNSTFKQSRFCISPSLSQLMNTVSNAGESIQIKTSSHQAREPTKAVSTGHSDRYREMRNFVWRVRSGVDTFASQPIEFSGLNASRGGR